MKLSLITKAVSLIMLSVTFAFAQAGRSDGKSERFDTDDVKTLNGTITKVDHPLATFKTDDGKEYQIHMGPYWFWQREDYALKPNAKAKLKGEVETVKGTMHFYPWEIVQDGKTLKLADDDGVPEWAGKRGRNGHGKGVGYGNGRGRGNQGRGCGRCCG
jgi:hypothetical protein